MPKGVYQIPEAYNEPINSYAPGTPERESLLAKYKEMYGAQADILMTIGGEKISSNDKRNITPPHDHQHVIGSFYKGDKSHIEKAIAAALSAKADWESLSWEHRASIFLKAAELLAGPYRDKINAATMLAQSKNVHQTEIDAACELIDFLRFNVGYMQQIYEEQPYSSEGIWNRLEYRPLEGFVFALTPFNFTAIAGNLPASAALMGNTVVWKPANTQIYSAAVIMEVFEKAGLPAGVINLVFVDGSAAGDVIFSHPEFAGIHFTGSTGVFKHLWKTIGNNIDIYKSYPRIVGETGGKDFIMVHPSAEANEVSTAIARGAFEFQGQKCSAASRAYIPKSLWPAVKEDVLAQVKTFKMGSPENPENFITAVIDEKSFDKIESYIEYIKEASDAEILIGGNCDKSKGYFIEPTIVTTTNPDFRTMCEEIFGPVITIYVYEDEAFEDTLTLLDNTSPYALTGSVFSRDRYAIELATKRLSQSAGNFYINDKPTGAVVGQQPFGGARGSGTNDKAGSYLNLLRWVSPRNIKETFVPPINYKYPYLG